MKTVCFLNTVLLVHSYIKVRHFRSIFLRPNTDNVSKIKKILNVILNWVECAKLSKYKTKTMKNEMGKLVQKGIIAAVTNRLLQEEQICLLEKKEKKYHIQLKSMGSQDRSIFWDTLMEVLFKTYVQNYS